MNTALRLVVSLLLAGCTVGPAPTRTSPAPVPPVAEEKPAPKEVAAAPQSAPPVVSTTPPSQPAAPATAIAPSAGSRPAAPAAPAKAPPRAPAQEAKPTSLAKAPPAAVAPRPAAPPPLDLRSLEERLRDTNAIGVLTKLSLKNQVDDLVARFRTFHEGKRPPTLSELRPAFELLLMKVLSLLQDHDTRLANDVIASRDAIWQVLSDRDEFVRYTR